MVLRACASYHCESLLCFAFQGMLVPERHTVFSPSLSLRVGPDLALPGPPLRAECVSSNTVCVKKGEGAPLPSLTPRDCLPQTQDYLEQMCALPPCLPACLPPSLSVSMAVGVAHRLV